MHVQAYLYQGYWEDIGTVEAFYESNLALTDNPAPKFRCLRPLPLSPCCFEARRSFCPCISTDILTFLYIFSRHMRCQHSPSIKWGSPVSQLPDAGFEGSLC